MKHMHKNQRAKSALLAICFVFLVLIVSRWIGRQVGTLALLRDDIAMYIHLNSCYRLHMALLTGSASFVWVARR